MFEPLVTEKPFFIIYFTFKFIIPYMLIKLNYVVVQFYNRKKSLLQILYYQNVYYNF